MTKKIAFLAGCFLALFGATPSGAQSLSISNASVTEGDSGALNAVFQVILSPASAQTVTVNYATSDGTATLGSSADQTFANTSTLNLNPVSPYPSTIAVPALPGLVNRVTVQLSGFSHQFPGSSSFLLVGPQGQKVLLMSGAGGFTTATNVSLTFDDEGVPVPSTLATGIFRPTVSGSAPVFTSPAPAGPYGASLSAFNGTNPVGTWSLYARNTSGSGSVAGGWSLTFASGDYTSSSGTLTFGPGVLSQTLSVPVHGDTRVESDEAFVVTLSGAVNATIADDRGAGLIANDDTPPRFTSVVINPGTVAAAGSSILTWATTNATAVFFEGNPASFPPSGTATVNYTGSSVYKLSAIGPKGTATAAATVTRLPSAGRVLGFPQITSPASGETVYVAGVSFAWSQVPSAAGYDVRIFNGDHGAVVFSGSLLGASSTSTLITLPPGLYLFALRACGANSFADFNCDNFSTSAFTVSPIAATQAPTITAPAQSAQLATSTQTLGWTSVPKTNQSLPLFYEVLLEDLVSGATALQITVPDPTTSTIASLASSPLYKLRVRACQAACGQYSAPLYFGLGLGAVPTSAPTITSVPITSGNSLTASWTSVAGADFYRIEIVQPPPAGPGGGALTVAARQVSGTSVTVPVPPGTASVVVQGCNGDGCGPFSPAQSINPPGPNPTSPQLGSPLAGSNVAGPSVFFSWSRIPGDVGSTTYRLFVQDLSRQSPALDVFTTQNFWAAFFKAEGSRYDALVVANPTGTQVSGPALGFNVKGTSATSPTMVQPAHQSSLPQGNVQLAWSPVPGASLYEYFVAIQGLPNATARGVTPGLVVQVPLPVIGGVQTFYSGIVRACPAGATCLSGSDAGWGPWSNVPGGPGVTNFSVTP